MNQHPEIKAKGDPEWTTLYDHLNHVRMVAEVVASYLGLDRRLAKLGAILHDIGKTSPIFQRRLKKIKSNHPFRHEIASLFFLPLFSKEDWPVLTEMIIAHHKSVRFDIGEKGIIDLEEIEADPCGFHLTDWDIWSPVALEILEAHEVSIRSISIQEARAAYDYVLEFCENKICEPGYSIWRGLLMAADHFGSALIEDTSRWVERLFQQPNLDFFNRPHHLFPLSLYPVDNPSPHTVVVACTGAGKTDYLFRRCRGRVFYVLPFQASINAMYYRLAQELREKNPDLDLRLRHGASVLIKSESPDPKDTVVQSLIGAGIKVLTPFQIASIAFGNKSYEATIADLKGCDIILDEVHTYSDKAQAMVLKLIEVLRAIGCRIHVGTATMPSKLFDAVLDRLGLEQTHLVRMTPEELDSYNRHKIIKVYHLKECRALIQQAIDREEKVLLVANQVNISQRIFYLIEHYWPEVPKLLLHSRFKRDDRRKLELRLLGKNKAGKSIGQFNTSTKACIVVSTQVVEVSLDISFDLMITDCAPLDSMIQRFGRINRRRALETIGKTRPIAILRPPADEKKCRPYTQEVLSRSFDILPVGLLPERELTNLLDLVYPEIDLLDIEQHTIYHREREWQLGFLLNNRASLLQFLEIDSVVCIRESDVVLYRNGKLEQRMGLEIPIPYHTVKTFTRLEYGNWPFVIPDDCYEEPIGLLSQRLKMIHVLRNMV